MKSTVYVLEGKLTEGRAWKHKRAEEVFMKQIIKRTKDKNEQ